MTDEKDFYYPRQPEKLLTATRGWPWQEAAFYSLILDVIYQLQGQVQDDLDAVRTWVGIDLKPKEFATFRDRLIAAGKLYRTPDGYLRNPRSDQWFAKRSAERKEKVAPNSTQNRSKVAKKPVDFTDGFTPESDAVLSNKNNKTPPKTPLFPDGVPARVRDSQSQSHSKSLGPGQAQVITEVGQIAEALGQERGRYWEADYPRMLETEELTFEDVLAAAQAHKGGPLRSIRGLSGLARLKRDERIRTQGTSRPAIVRADISRDTWGQELVLLAGSGVWDSTTLGPMPGTPGFAGPPDLERKFLDVWKAQGCHPRTELDRNHYRREYPADDPDPERRTRWSTIKP